MRLRKEKSGNSGPNSPISSYPEAEDEVRIFTPATRAALRQAKTEPCKAIVSIDGRDVEEIPSTKDRAA